MTGMPRLAGSSSNFAHAPGVARGSMVEWLLRGHQSASSGFWFGSASDSHDVELAAAKLTSQLIGSISSASTDHPAHESLRRCH
jgi:hypothetical protein